MSISVNLPNGQILKGTHPIVIIGPNGSGKTRLGATITDTNSGEMIGAVRNLEIQAALPVQTPEAARTNLTNLKRNRRKQPWTIANEIDHLFSKLVTEDATAAQKFRDQWTLGGQPPPERTALMRLRDLWSDVMPGRTLNFESYAPTVTSNLAGTSKAYPARQMSDGERVALYLAGRVLDADKRIVVVDEPEVHFHARLAARFWNALERERSDLRFIYITHDLAFARSRRPAQYVLVKPEGPSVLDVDATLPPEVAEALLSAASFSIQARRIVFCEGSEGGTDAKFFGRWFRDDGTAVIPVGACGDVRDSTRAFGNSNLVEGVEAIGIVDRDYWSARQLFALEHDVVVLPVHEVESLYCLEAVFRAVALHLAIPSDEMDTKHREFLDGVRSHFTGAAFAKQVSERFKRRIQERLHDALNSLRMANDLGAVRERHIAGIQATARRDSLESVFDEEMATVSGSLNDHDTMVRILPGKNLIGIAARVLGVQPDRYKGLVNEAIDPSDSEADVDNMTGNEVANAEPKRLSSDNQDENVATIKVRTRGRDATSARTMAVAGERGKWERGSGVSGTAGMRRPAARTRGVFHRPVPARYARRDGAVEGGFSEG